MTTTASPRPAASTETAQVIDRVWAGLKVMLGLGAYCPACRALVKEVRAESRRAKFAYIRCGCGAADYQTLFMFNTYRLEDANRQDANTAPTTDTVQPHTHKETSMSKKPAPAPAPAPQAIDDLIDDRTLDNAIARYPVAQWVNGDPKLARLGGVAALGGIVIPFNTKRGRRTIENIPADLSLPGFERGTYEFSSGNSEACLLATSAALTVIRLRRCWFIKRDGETTYYPWDQYAPGMRGKYQVLVMIGGQPFALTFSGTNSREFDKAMAEVDAAGTKLAQSMGLKKALPRCGVSFTLKAGAVCQPNEKYTSKTTPPTFDAAAGVTFVGVDGLRAYQALYLAAEAWVQAYNAPNTDTARATNGAHLDAGPGPDEADEIPF